jgi:hypothetical protein
MGHAAFASNQIKGGPFIEAPSVHGGQSLLRGYSNLMEGRGDGHKRLNLGRSIDRSCKSFQYFWVGCGVVSFTPSAKDAL